MTVNEAHQSAAMLTRLFFPSSCPSPAATDAGPGHSFRLHCNTRLDFLGVGGQLGATDGSLLSSEVGVRNASSSSFDGSAALPRSSINRAMARGRVE
ncbi:hypothetical protein MUK42_14217 [Musa troglodytarum]|uniref:Uncharacterized protein n=1 Tax=Musa troglodytarum TaxID=320322 RepID=A0A9E7L8A8_9LILI|nr:hypothetical protein MUK42_14217 [Musa troglodytarum]